MTNEDVMLRTREVYDKNLTNLNLSNNQLTELPPEIVELKNLTNLNLSKNKLTQLPSEIVKLKNLKNLLLFDNQLTELPPEIVKLKNLTNLNLSKNKLIQLPPEIAGLNNFTYLILSSNKLAKLQPEIAEPKNFTIFAELPSEVIKELKYIINHNFSDYELAQLQPEIAELKNLTDLDLFDNQLITSLSISLLSGRLSLDSISSLLHRIIRKLEYRSLSSLDFSDNQLTQLPPEITELKNLTHLDLTFNQLAQLPLEITEFKNLKNLDLSYNRLTQLPLEIVELKNLISLNLSNNQLTQLSPEIVELKNLTNLDLSNNQLTQLSPEIAELKNLKNLNLSKNKLTQLPSEIAEFKNLINLDLSENQLTQLPSEIAEFKNLINLDLSKNKLTQLPLEIAELKNLINLDLSKNKLTQLPLEIAELKNLINLDLSENQLTQLPSEIAEFKNLKYLDLSENQLTELPPESAELKNLISFNLSNNQLTQLSPEIVELKNLKNLNLSNNQLTELPPEIVKLKNLTNFNLSKNKLIQLPPEIAGLNNFTYLILSSNKLAKLSPEIAEPKNLTNLGLFDNQLTKLLNFSHITSSFLSINHTSSLLHRIIRKFEFRSLSSLDFSDNQLTQLPPEITELKNLTHLDLTFNQLAQLPLEITEFKNLKNLDLSYNRLTQLPLEIVELKNLISLNLSNNQLTQLSPEIVELKNLTNLDLSNNQLTQLSPEIVELKNLTNLNLSNNQLTQLPSEIVELKNLTNLDLSNNPLTSPPPEIISLGLEAIFTYLKQSKTTENNETKLILVGNGEVGKTCLANRLITDKFIEDKITEGINISKWVLPSPEMARSEIKLNVWDFGGQEIYHATHQFFLTTRSVYLLVWNARKAKDYDNIYYWLHTIEAFGGDSPVILVMSKMNESDDDLNLKDLRSKFPQIKDYRKIDSKDGTGISVLKEIIRKTAWNLPLMKVRWVDSWYRVREKLEGLREHWITYGEFRKICISERLDDENVSTLDRYLHELGVTLHFKDRVALRNIVILKPEWATGAFYKILSTKSVLQREGVLLQSELDEIWDKETYPPDVYPQLMELMNKFELAYQLPDKNSYLIPELLPKSSPDFDWNDEENLYFYYSYDSFLPSGIITRFIVRMHQEIEKKENGMPLCWREGAVLKLQNSRALVKMKPDEKQIEIRIKGDNKRGALGAICNELDQINASIKKINVSKQIPCNCSDNCPERFSYEMLLKAEMKNVDVQCRQNLNMISASLLLDGYKRREDRMEEYNEILRKNGINLTINPTISSTISPTINPTVETKVDANQTMKAKLDANVNVNVNIDLKIDLPQIRNEFDNLKDELENLDPKIDSDLDKIQDSLDELSPNSDQEKLIKPLNKLNRFLVKLSDPDSNYNKVIKGTEKGIELAQKLGKTYNKFAQWLAMPQVPDLFLGK